MTRDQSAALSSVVLLVLSIALCALWPALAIHRHNSLANELGDAVRNHATTHSALKCDPSADIQVGNLLGAGGEECDLGVSVSCIGSPPDSSFSVALPSGDTRKVEVEGEGDRVVLTSFIDSIDPGWDPRCW